MGNKTTLYPEGRLGTWAPRFQFEQGVPGQIGTKGGVCEPPLVVGREKRVHADGFCLNMGTCPPERRETAETAWYEKKQSNACPVCLGGYDFFPLACAPCELGRFKCIGMTTPGRFACLRKR
jgi:hypothetical protein